MRRRSALLSLIIGPALLAAPRAALAADPPPRPPSFVLIYIDDLGWTDLACMGSRYYETPNIDALARDGVAFTSAYANAPNCAPSRACLLTGRYTPRHGIYTVNNSARGKAQQRKLIPTPNRRVLDGDALTIAEALKPAGYTSAAIGKWHLGSDPETGPLAQGFGVNIAGGQAGHPSRYFSPYRLPGLPDGPRGEYLTNRLTDEALAFIDANRDRPFFLYLSHYAVHTPLQGKKELIAKYEAKDGDEHHDNPVYAAMIESVDQSVGRIAAKLNELDLADDTLIIFFSDNGGYAGATSQSPLRGCKGMLYEGGVRVPMIMRWRGHIEPMRACDTPVIGTDLFPTLLELARLEAPEDTALDGLSLVPLLMNTGDLRRDAIYWHFPAYLQAGRGVPGIWRTTPAGAIRMGDWKLIEFFEDGRLELYNLRQDIGEQHNLIHAHPEKAEELHQAMRRWRASIDAPVPREPNPEYQPPAAENNTSEDGGSAHETDDDHALPGSGAVSADQRAGARGG